jgi:hypothetical protein
MIRPGPFPVIKANENKGVQVFAGTTGAIRA